MSTHKLCVTVSDEQLSVIDEYAESRGLDRSKAARELLSAGCVYLGIEWPDYQFIDNDQRAELGKIPWHPIRGKPLNEGG